ncbi:MAG: hypothetical protein QOD63_306 [Actinomycetota bacterium]|nr:hypothetical protein [Actinomycetota bacterium]
MTPPIRIRRLATELRMRRRRLDAYRAAPPWPGKDPAWRSEQIRYDHLLVLAAEMLEVPVADPPEWPLDPAVRAVIEDRLGGAGFDVMAPTFPGTGDPLADGDLHP